MEFWIDSGSQSCGGTHYVTVKNNVNNRVSSPLRVRGTFIHLDPRWRLCTVGRGGVMVRCRTTYSIGCLTPTWKALGSISMVNRLPDGNLKQGLLKLCLLLNDLYLCSLWVALDKSVLILNIHECEASQTLGIYFAKTLGQIGSLCCICSQSIKAHHDLQ